MRIQADRDVCIQAGNCVMSASTVFDQDEDGTVVLLVDEVPDSEQKQVREAVMLCPSQALRIVD